MPLNMNVILAPFLMRAKWDFHLIHLAMERIARQVKLRLERSNAMERATRDFPELDFRDDAVAAAIDVSQFGAIKPNAVEPVWPASVRQELILPRFFIELRRMTDSVRDSIKRFETPRPEMFAGGKGRFVDIFGQIGMLMRVFIQDYRPVQLLEDTVRRIPHQSQPTSAPAPATPEASDDSLARIPVLLAGALLLIPAVLGFAEAFAHHLDIGVRRWLLMQLEQVQQSVYELRRQVLTTFLEGMRSAAESAVEMLFMLDHVLVRNVVYWGRFASIYVLLLGKQIGAMTALIAKWVNLAIMVASVIATAAEALQKVMLPGGLLFGELLEAITGGTSDLMLKGLDVLDKTVSNPLLHEALDAYRAIVRIAAHPPADVRPVLPAFPDIYKAAIAPARFRLTRIFRDLRNAVVPGVGDLLVGAGGMMTKLGDAASRAAGDSTVIDPRVWDQLVGTSSDLSDRIFAGQAYPETQDSLADLYQSQLLAAGFGTINAAIPRYMRGVADWWRERRSARGESPVSPHILRRRARLARVRVPRLLLRVHGFDIGNQEARSALLQALQQRMKEKTEEAWRTGELQLANG